MKNVNIRVFIFVLGVCILLAFAYSEVATAQEGNPPVTEVLYDTETNDVRAWNMDMNVVGNLNPQSGEKVIFLFTKPPTIESDWYKVDLAKGIIAGNTEYVSIKPAAHTLGEKVIELEQRIAILEAKLK